MIKLGFVIKDRWGKLQVKTVLTKCSCLAADISEGVKTKAIYIYKTQFSSFGKWCERSKFLGIAADFSRDMALLFYLKDSAETLLMQVLQNMMFILES